MVFVGRVSKPAPCLVSIGYAFWISSSFRMNCSPFARAENSRSTRARPAAPIDCRRAGSRSSSTAPRQHLSILRRHEIPGFTVRDRFGRAAPVGADHRFATGHCLDIDHAVTLKARGATLPPPPPRTRAPHQPENRDNADGRVTPGRCAPRPECAVCKHCRRWSACFLRPR